MGFACSGCQPPSHKGAWKHKEETLVNPCALVAEKNSKRKFNTFKTQANMSTIIFIVLGLLVYALFYKFIHWFEKI